MIALGSVTFQSDGITLTQVIPEGYRPFTFQQVIGKIYNGSSYVDCQVQMHINGTIKVVSMFGSAISGAQPQYLTPKSYTYVSY